MLSWEVPSREDLVIAVRASSTAESISKSMHAFEEGTRLASASPPVVWARDPVTGNHRYVEVMWLGVV